MAGVSLAILCSQFNFKLSPKLLKSDCLMSGRDGTFGQLFPQKSATGPASVASVASEPLPHGAAAAQQERQPVRETLLPGFLMGGTEGFISRYSYGERWNM